MNLPPISPQYDLWPRDSPGHTKEVAGLLCVHSGPEAASLLVALANHSGLKPEDFSFARILRGLQALQNKDRTSPTYGCFRWYAEESKSNDTNAAFFIGLNLLMLRLSCDAALDDESRAILDAMFEPLDHWFHEEVLVGKAYYPNKFLGDLVCAWLLKEVRHQEPGCELIAATRAAGEYWRDQHWGWGEHLSDIYAEILLNELSCLLLLAKALPANLHALYLGLLHGLMEIEDAYAGGPRVPAIRNYDFTTVPCVTGFRSLIQAEPVPPTLVDAVTKSARPRMFQFGSLFHQLGWQELAGPRKPGQSAISVPCCGGAVAKAVLQDDFRMGSLSRYPIMPQTNHPTWGLSWQTMPVAFCGDQADWGILRWHTRENNTDRFHPARDKKCAYLNNALSESTAPPLIGHSQCHQQENRLVCLRTMPMGSRAWEEWGDGWDIVGFKGEILDEEHLPSGWSRIRLLLSGGRRLALFFHPLAARYRPILLQQNDEIKWRVRLAGAEIFSSDALAHLWLVGQADDPEPQLRWVDELPPGPLHRKWHLVWAPWNSPLTIQGAAAELTLHFLN